jgi:hypothetical protein
MRTKELNDPFEPPSLEQIEQMGGQRFFAKKIRSSESLLGLAHLTHNVMAIRHHKYDHR